MIQTLRVLNFIHSRGILHRDIKPANILLGNDGVKITDFGIAQYLNEHIREIRGTLAYLAPEILHNNADERSDIFSLGLTFFELIKNEKFYGEQDTMSRVVEILPHKAVFQSYQHNALSTVKNSVLHRILQKMTAYQPDDRYQTSIQVMQDMNTLLKSNVLIETSGTKEAYVLGATFVGRDDEFTWLTTHLASTTRKLILVRGTKGIGKSRLFIEFKKYCQLREIPFWESTSLPHLNKSFSTFLELLGEIILHLPQEDISLYGPIIKKLLPTHEKLKNIPDGLDSDPKTERAILIETISKIVLAAASRKTSLVIYFNDLHWVDQESLAVIDNILFKLSGEMYKNSPLMLYASMRKNAAPEHLSHFLIQLTDKNRLSSLRLSSFNDAHVTSFIEGIFGHTFIASSFRIIIPLIRQKVGGNPYFLQELIKYLVEKGKIDRPADSWELTVSQVELDVPKNLEEIVDRKVRNLQLDHSQQQCLEILALLNRRVETREFKALLELDDMAEFARFTHELERIEILTMNRSEGQVDYSICHSLLIEAVCKYISPERIKELHQHIANKLEKFHQSDLPPYYEELAYHFEMADQIVQAIDYYTRTGDLFSTQYVLDKAQNCFQKALQLNVQIHGKKHAITANLCDLLGSVLTEKGDVGAAERQLMKSLSIRRKLFGDEHSDVATTYNHLGELHGKYKGDYTQAEEYLEKALRIQTTLTEHDNDDVAKSLNDLAMLFTEKGDYNRALEYLKKSYDIIDRVLGYQHPDMASCLSNIGYVHLRQGTFRQALKYLEKSLTLKLELYGEKHISTAVAYNNIGSLYSIRRDDFRALSYLKKSLSTCIELVGEKHPHTVAALNSIGVLFVRKEEKALALQYLSRALNVQHELFGEIHPSNARILLSIARVFEDKREYQPALDNYLKALPIAILKVGEKDPVVAKNYQKIAEMYEHLTEYTQAISYYKKARTIYSQHNSTENIKVISQKLTALRAEGSDTSRL